VGELLVGGGGECWRRILFGFFILSFELFPVLV
jgi:hypothetical protein